jgi:hypothetical protein
MAFIIIDLGSHSNKSAVQECDPLPGPWQDLGEYSNKIRTCSYYIVPITCLYYKIVDSVPAMVLQFCDGGILYRTKTFCRNVIRCLDFSKIPGDTAGLGDEYKHSNFVLAMVLEFCDGGSH